MKDPAHIFKYALYAYFLLFAGLTLWHLSSLPVAWNDEVYFLDPAIQFLKTGIYGSKIWPQVGTEKFFFAHLPMISVVHVLNLSLFPWEIFYVRLPFVLLFGVGMYFLFLWLKNGMDLPMLWSLFFVFLYINDRGTGEALRSVRTEPLEICGLALVFWRVYAKKNTFWTAFFLSLLFLTHPKLWMIIAVVMVYLGWDAVEQHPLRMLGVLFCFAAPILAFLAYGKFDFAAIHTQLFSHAEEHAPGSDDTGLLYSHFMQRFWPYYSMQPYVPIVFYAALGFSVRSLVDGKWRNKLLEVSFMMSNVYWLFFLGAFDRYNGVLLLLPYALVAKHAYPYLKDVKLSFPKLAFFVFLVPCVVLVFMSRHVAAFVQRKERDLTTIHRWLDGFLQSKKEKKILLVHDSAGYYYTLSHSNIDFTLVYAVKKIDFQEYDEVYVLIWHKMDFSGYELCGEYLLPPVLGDAAASRPMTYNYSKLYRIHTPKALYMLEDEKLWRNNPCK